MNYWHDIEPGTADEMNVIIEIPKYSKNKYEIDKESGLIALDRALHTAQDYPFDYGFVPQTLWDDDDALDMVVLTTYALNTGILVRVRPVGIMEMNDGGESDDKVIGVPIDDPRWDGVQDIEDVDKHTQREIKHFFETYKGLQDTEVVVSAFKGREVAQEAFQRSIELYNEKFGE